MSGEPDFDNAATHFIDRHLERERGERVALRDPGGAFNYGELGQRSHRVAQVLSDAGVEAGSHVALVMRDSASFVAVFFGVLRRGAVPVLVPAALVPADVVRAIEDSQASTAIFDGGLYPAAAPALVGLRGLRSVFVLGDSPDSRAMSLATALANAGDGEFETWPTVADDLAFLLYAKAPHGPLCGVVHRMASLREAALCATREGGVVKLERDDVVLAAAPLSSAYGLTSAVALPLHAGAASVLVGDPGNAGGLVGSFVQHRPTLFFGTPDAFAALARSDADLRGSRVRQWICAGGDLDADTAALWQERGGAEIARVIGTAELLEGFWVGLAGQPPSVGVAAPGYELRVGDQDAVPVAPGEEGELWVVGPTSASLYWRRRDASQRAFIGRWTKTGCRAREVEPGRFEIASEPGAAAFVGASA